MNKDTQGLCLFLVSLGLTPQVKQRLVAVIKQQVIYK